MAIMAMATVRKAKHCSLLIGLLSSMPVYSVDLNVTPNIQLIETYTDNVESTAFDQNDSFVTTAAFGISSTIESNKLNASLDGTYSRLEYTHDHDLDKGYKNLSSEVSYLIWDKGLTINAGASIDNVPRNTAENGFADIISGETVQTERYNGGFDFKTQNSTFNFDSKVDYSNVIAEDSIGESSGYTASLSFTNSTGVKNFFWDVNSQYYDRENDNETARSYTLEAKVGLITSVKFNPFLRYYDENLSGSVDGQASETGDSFGPGIRWNPKDSLILEVSYNFVDDEQISDDYVAVLLDWAPTSRTKVHAEYDQKFYGDSYQFDLSHRIKRVTNSISYNETIDAFRRDNLAQGPEDIFYCPIGQPIDPSLCQDSPEGFDDFIEVPFSDLEPVEDDEFSINKVLTWTSELTLSRTVFSLNVSERKRENLSSGSEDKYFYTRITATRNTSQRGSITLSGSFNRSEYNSNSVNENEQKDYYRLANLFYNRQLANSLSANVGVQYLNRTSNLEIRTYDETRFTLSINKEF